MFRDQTGNLLIIEIEIEKHRITLASLYGPNSDDPDFYEKMNKIINNFGNSDIIVVGDWNLLLNTNIDGVNYKHLNNPNSRQKVLKLMSDLNLYDIWREENQEKNTYTWKRKLQPGLIQMGRLDFFLVSETLVNFSCDEAICAGYRTDHSLISISLKFINTPKANTFWKFNNSLLNNPNFIEEIKNVIEATKRQYCASPYNIEKIM